MWYEPVFPISNTAYRTCLSDSIVQREHAANSEANRTISDLKSPRRRLSPCIVTEFDSHIRFFKVIPPLKWQTFFIQVECRGCLTTTIVDKSLVLLMTY